MREPIHKASSPASLDSSSAPSQTATATGNQILTTWHTGLGSRDKTRDRAAFGSSNKAQDDVTPSTKNAAELPQLPMIGRNIGLIQLSLLQNLHRKQALS